MKTSHVRSIEMMTSRCLRKRGASAFVAVVAAGLSAAAALAQYYPPTTAPLFPAAGNKAFQVIDAALAQYDATYNAANPTKTQLHETVVLPTPSGYTAPSASDFAAAVTLAVNDLLAGHVPPVPAGSNYSYTVSDVSVSILVQAAAQLRPTGIGAVVKSVATQIVSQATTANQPIYIEEAVYQAALAAGNKGATAVVTNAVAGILAYKGTNAINATDYADLTAMDIEAAPTQAGKTIAAVISGTKKSFLTPGADDGVIQAAVAEVISSGYGYLLNSIGNATAYSVLKSVTGPAVPATLAEVVKTFANAVFSNGLTNRATAIQLAAGLAAGGTAPNTGSVEAAIDGSSFSAFTAQMNEAIDAYSAVISNSSTNPNVNPTAPGAEVQTYIGSAQPVDLDATVAGAVAAYPKVAASIIAGVLTASSSDPNNTASATAIITSGVFAYPTSAALDAKAIVNFSGTTPSAATAAVIAGTTKDLVGLVVASAVKGLSTPATDVAYPGLVGGIVAASVTQSETSGYNSSIANLVYDATKTASKQDSGILTAALGGANLNANPIEAAEIVAGAVAAVGKDAAALKTAADTYLSSHGLDASLANIAANLVNAILNAPKTVPTDPLVFFEQTNAALAAVSGGNQANQVLAIVYAATQAKPTATSAIVATAIAKSGETSPSEEAALVAAATGAKFAAAGNIKAAADAAVHVTLGTSDLFAYVADTVTAEPTYVVDIVTGATAAAPQFANIIGHAVAFSNPLSAAKAVPALFSFSTLSAPNLSTGGAGDQVARTAAITAGLVDGLVESNNAKVQTALKAVVSAAVKAALYLHGPGNTFAQSNGGAGTFTTTTTKGPAGVVTGYVSQVVDPNSATTDVNANVDAVLTAAGKSGKAYILEIAQAAAQAAASVYLEGSGHGAVPQGAYSSIVTALSGINALDTPAQITNAVNFGISQADASIVGAGAAGVVNYTTHPVSGTVVTSIYNL